MVVGGGWWWLVVVGGGWWWLVVVGAARRQRATLVNPPFDVDQFLDILRRQGLVQTTRVLAAYRSLI